MKCKICGAQSGKYSLCRACNIKKEQGKIIKCEKCGGWHYTDAPCPEPAASPDSGKYLYEVRGKLISKSEEAFFNVIKSSVPEGYCVFPQINLASFIDRTDDSRFHNELFRNVDFLVTDGEYAPKLIIEINDQTHLTGERRERDEKVHKICEEAGIPILTLWTSYGINPEYIKGKINEILDKLPVARIRHFVQTSPAEQADNTSSLRQNKYAGRKNGCYVATCVYGSYDCPEVWVLRRYRDNTLDGCFLGRTFIKIYYAVSPKLVKLFGKQNWFVCGCKSVLDKHVYKLREKGIPDTPYDDKY